jgi:hypothetical protein
LESLKRRVQTPVTGAAQAYRSGLRREWSHSQGKTP